MHSVCDFSLISSRFRTLWGPFWDSFGFSWVLLGAFWEPLGVSWAPLGRSWGDLGRSWGDLGRSWGDLGTFKAAPETSWAALGPLWGRSWPLPGVPGRSGLHFQASELRFWVSRESIWDPTAVGGMPAKPVNSPYPTGVCGVLNLVVCP